MSAASDLSALAERIEAARSKAAAVLEEVRAIGSESGPTEPGAAEAWDSVRRELEEAADELDKALDYLTRRPDDDAPECCAHRRLQAFIAGEEHPPA